MAGRFVAVGDSFTEGVGDWNRRFPNGVRGWADRVAKQLSKRDNAWEYANLALRSRTLDDIVAMQVDRAVDLQPTLVSFFAGGNDILRLRSDMEDLMRRYEAAVARLAASGARVMLFTSYDLKLSPLLEPLRRRNNYFNRRVREIALQRDALLIDHWAMRAYRHPRMWEPDRLHMSRHGHRYLAAAVLRALQVDHSITIEDLGSVPHRTLRQVVADEREWWGDWVRPMLGRRMRGTPAGHEITAKWADPIRPAQGMKRIARLRAEASEEPPRTPPDSHPQR
ncbi:MAG TPA: SGNH/GDSL hydrolase family protein [Nocardioidaceae bacterium]|nr:SGNH/GDSL hydrolase family protein [Nocardioidaceae bacterium]